jgi:hydroxymethylpyrimidine pyrophosphatase-like HAD family hydrolase
MFVFDIDGTMANAEHRLPLIEKGPGKKPNWKAFYQGMTHDTEYVAVMTVLVALWNMGREIVLLTGRPEEYRQNTIDWLTNIGLDQAIIDSLGILMRPTGDYREDTEVKSELLDKFAKKYKESFGTDLVIEGIFEDRQRVIDMWRAKGYYVFNCAQHGNDF